MLGLAHLPADFQIFLASVTKQRGPMKPKVEVETISEREHVLKVDGEVIGVSKNQYDALFHKHFLDRKFDEAFKAGQESMKART